MRFLSLVLSNSVKAKAPQSCTSPHTMRCCLQGLEQIHPRASHIHLGEVGSRHHRLDILCECTWRQATVTFHEVLLLGAGAPQRRQKPRTLHRLSIFASSLENGLRLHVEATATWIEFEKCPSAPHPFQFFQVRAQCAFPGG